jgi:hypothetical protein
MFKAPIYREIARDEEATGAAVLVLVVASIIGGIISGLTLPLQLGAQLQDPQVRQMLRELNIDPAMFVGGGAIIFGVVNAVLAPIFNLIAWAIFSWLNGFIANQFFNGKATTSGVMRVFGFAYVYYIFAGIPCIGLVFSLVIPIITNVIGIGEAAELETGNAFLTWLISIALVLLVVVGIPCCLIFGLILLGGAAGN